MAEASCTLTINGRQIKAQVGETLLEAARGAGLTLPCNCEHGICEGCRVTVASGSVDDQGTGIQRSVLACKALVSDDAEIEQARTPSSKKYRGHVARIQQISEELYELHISFETPLSWVPGQSFRVTFRGMPEVNLNSTFSLEAKTEFNVLVFHLEKAMVPEHIEMLDKKIKEGKPVSVTGPFGTSFLQREEERLIFFVGPEGFAPAWSVAVSAAMGQPTREKLFVFDESFKSDAYSSAFNWMKDKGISFEFATLQRLLNENTDKQLFQFVPSLNEFDVVFCAGTQAFTATVKEAVRIFDGRAVIIPIYQPGDEAAFAELTAKVLEEC